MLCANYWTMFSPSPGLVLILQKCINKTWNSWNLKKIFWLNFRMFGHLWRFRSAVKLWNQFSRKILICMDFFRRRFIHNRVENYFISLTLLEFMNIKFTFMNFHILFISRICSQKQTTLVKVCISTITLISPRKNLNGIFKKKWKYVLLAQTNDTICTT